MKHSYEPKPLFIERMKSLLGKENYGRYWEKIQEEELRSIRVNTLKISPEELKERLEKKSWIIKQPFKENPEIFVIEGKYVGENSKEINENPGKVDKNLKENYDIKNISAKSSAKPTLSHRYASNGERKIMDLEPGELGRALEHLLGYYYVQELASMLPVLVLNPKPNETILDLCASPGSKTTQMAAMMKNLGVLIANEIKMDRMKILASNLERCGVANVVLTKKDGAVLCRKLKEKNFAVDKILVDAPCSGEGTIRSSPKTLLMWNINTVNSLSKLQKNLLSSAIEALKIGGEIVYSTCTHAPEENEEVLDYILKKFGNMIKIEKINLPVKCAPGILEWNGENYNKEVEKSCRIYPHITNTEGFFISKIRRVR